MSKRDGELERYLDHARRELFPKMKGSAFCMTIAGEPDAKLCLETGAAIWFNKPIIVIVPRGVAVPLALRTIAHKIVEDVDLKDESSRERVTAAIQELMATADFRK